MHSAALQMQQNY